MIDPTQISLRVLPGTTGPSPESLRGLRILVVDDSPINLLVVESCLIKLGSLVETAPDGNAAVAKASCGHFDAILMDLQMPGMDGFEASRAIRARGGGDGVPIIALTASAPEAVREACDSAGINDYVCKPINRLQLASTLMKWIPPQSDGHGGGCASAAVAVGGGAAPSPFDEPFDVPGLDLGEASRVLGTQGWATLRVVLKRFFADFSRAPEQLAHDLNEGNFDAALRLAHTVKGLAPTIGAPLLSQVATAFEAQLQVHDASGHAAFDHALRQTLANIAPFANQSDAARSQHSTGIDLTKILLQLQALAEMLARGRASAIDLSQNIASTLSGSELQRAYALVAQPIEMLDFDKALKQLKLLAAEHDWNLS